MKESKSAKENLKTVFYNLVKRYDGLPILAEQLWTEIEKAYTQKGRIYHNLHHIDALYALLLNYQSKIADWGTLCFSIIYPDIIYSVQRSDNEERSAQFAADRLAQLNYPISKIEVCCAQIIATKSRGHTDDNDTNLFTDADLAILGSDWKTYQQYAKAIRKEYHIYPNLLYQPGRKKVLEHFLSFDSIYKTEEFGSKFENQAIANLTKELQNL